MRFFTGLCSACVACGCGLAFIVVWKAYRLYCCIKVFMSHLLSGEIADFLFWNYRNTTWSKAWRFHLLHFVCLFVCFQFDREYSSCIFFPLYAANSITFECISDLHLSFSISQWWFFCFFFLLLTGDNDSNQM